MGQPCHIEGVGDDESLEPKLAFQQIGDDCRGNCGDMIGIRIERGHGHVRHHDRIDARCDGLAKGGKFGRVQVSAVDIHAGNTQMRIGCRVAVSREVLHRSQHSAFVRTFDVGGGQIADLFGIFSERPGIDDGVGRVRVHIRIWIEIPVNSDGPGLLRRDAAGHLGVFGFAIGAERHGVRKVCCPHQARGDAAFEVGGKEQWQFGVVLQAIEQFGSFVRFAA